jgi:ubiquitin-protein ligase
MAQSANSDRNAGFTLQHAVAFISSILANPNCATPLVTAIAAQYKESPRKSEAQFDETNSFTQSAKCEKWSSVRSNLPM